MLLLTRVLFSTIYTHKEERKKNHYINNEMRVLLVNPVGDLKFYTPYIIKFKVLILKNIK
ncbi:uncharacterized protein METZ01_LOCUS370382, partial [marine metagenome]